jgi:hypothetical protein
VTVPNDFLVFSDISLQHVSMAFRSQTRWELLQPIPNMGSRYRQKQYHRYRWKIHKTIPKKGFTHQTKPNRRPRQEPGFRPYGIQIHPGLSNNVTIL